MSKAMAHDTAEEAKVFAKASHVLDQAVHTPATPSKRAPVPAFLEWDDSEEDEDADSSKFGTREFEPDVGECCQRPRGLSVVSRSTRVASDYLDEDDDDDDDSGDSVFGEEWCDEYSQSDFDEDLLSLMAFPVPSGYGGNRVEHVEDVIDVDTEEDPEVRTEDQARSVEPEADYHNLHTILLQAMVCMIIVTVLLALLRPWSTFCRPAGPPRLSGWQVASQDLRTLLHFTTGYSMCVLFFRFCIKPDRSLDHVASRFVGACTLQAWCLVC